MEYIGVDWGTSNFRAYLLSADGKIHNQKSGDKGLKDLKKEEFEDYLLSHISPWLKDSHKPVILCGMVGSQMGWHEVPYIDVENIMTELPKATYKIPTKAQALEAYIISGACQKSPKPMDVMRGEETQIYGFLKQNREFSGYIILPGTHSKWVEVKEGEIASFKTFMTGEFYQIIKQYSLLSSMIIDEDFAEKDFQKGLVQSMKGDTSLTNDLFSLRATALLAPKNKYSVSSYLSGLLIGLEFARLKDKSVKANIVIIGSPSLMEIYEKACLALGIQVQCYGGEKATITGLLTCIKQIKGNAS